MWLLTLMSSKWYARKYDDEFDLRADLDDAFVFVNEGTVISICDDLETWCDEMDVNIETVTVTAVEAE